MTNSKQLTLGQKLRELLERYKRRQHSKRIKRNGSLQYG